MNNVLTGEIGASSSIDTYKIVVLGDISVGKTSILSRFRYGVFEPEYMPTLGIDFFSQNLFYEDKTIRLILWDTAGEERFRSLIPSYLKNADCIIIVFDITNKESFLSLNRWLTDAKNNANENTIFVICGNKIDLKEKRTVNENEINEFIGKNELIYMECSAKNGQGIKDLFNIIAKNLGENNFAKSDFNVRGDINNNDTNNNIVELSNSNYIIKQNLVENENKKNNNTKNNIELNNVKSKKRKKFFCC